MATILLPPDFKDFLQLLNSEKVEYLLAGGYAVGYYGYPRATGDMDIWVAATRDNAERIARVLRAFGFAAETVSPELFLEEGRIVRMGVPPMRIELLTGASGVDFTECYADRKVDTIDGVEVSFISLEHLKLNKKAAAGGEGFERPGELAVASPAVAPLAETSVRRRGRFASCRTNDGSCRARASRGLRLRAVSS